MPLCGGKLLTCGGLAIRLPPAPGDPPAPTVALLRLAALWGRLPKPAADCQNPPAAVNSMPELCRH